MGRLFIAVVPSDLKENPELKQLLSKLKRTTKERGQDVRWTAPELWHVTLAFLGEEKVERAQAALEDFLKHYGGASSGLVLRLQGLGAFPSAGVARVLWLGVQESQDFLDLQAALQAHLKTCGFNTGTKESRPHLTLGRFRNLINIDDLVKLGGRKHFGDCPVRELILFESVLQGNIPKYVPRFRVAFQ